MSDLLFQLERTSIFILWYVVLIIAASTCKISEFVCGNGRCVPLNRYCNNLNDCGDSSDEPRYCTPCNRTYYGEIGQTYDLELHRPKEPKIPYICHLTFTANGGEFGDIVQLTFDSFTIGRFVSFTSNGCPDGALQITESDRPHVGGSWCGTSWGPVIYYSETKSVTLSVSLLRLAKDQNGYNFDFRMEYKLLKKTAATVRYGGGTPFFLNTTAPSIQAEPEYYLGDLITGTYCSRIFSDCDRKHCRLQSPNFPGLYPRNVTCYYAVRQHEIPEGKHALISVRQSKGQLISIRSRSELYGTASSRELKVWTACDEVQDYVTVYDGYTIRDPIIIKFCGGGEAVPEAVSSGHELLVEFSTSPYGTFLHPTPVQALHGFQLEVEVKFVDQLSPTFVKNQSTCEFWIRGTGKGILENPLHSLAGNTTCLYHLQGIDTTVSSSPVPFRPLSRYPDGIWRQTKHLFPPSQYRVWLSVIKFHATGSRDPQKQDQEMCRSSLKVWDGQVRSGTNCNDLFCSQDKSKSISRTSLSGPLGALRNVTLLARYCREHIPKTCDHSMLANNTRFPRPCSLSESFLSSGDSVTLELQISDSTALRPIYFRALYEFVDLHQDGDPYEVGPCSRKFSGIKENSKQKFKSPRDIFLYGRGGANNLSCIYRFEAQKDEKIKITLTGLEFKNRRCRTRISPDSDRLQCYGNTSAAVRFFEVPWNDVPAVPRDCLCSGNDDGNHLPFTYISTSNVVELRFDVIGMNASDDFTTLFFEGTWNFIRTPVCKGKLRKEGPSGEIIFQFPNESPDELNCETYPRVIMPSPKRYLYAKISGVILKHSSKQGNETTVSSIRCGTSNRITVHTALYSATICPFVTSSRRHNLVEVFSEGWTIGSTIKAEKLPVDKVEIDRLGQDLSKTIVVEFLAKELGTYVVSWLEISRRKIAPVNGYGLLWMKSDECQYRCPELDACINASVWCDGVEDCPSGIDEALTHCSILLQLPPLYLFLGALGILTSSVATCAIAWKRCRRRPRSFLQTRLKSLSSDTAIIDEKEVIC